MSKQPFSLMLMVITATVSTGNALSKSCLALGPLVSTKLVHYIAEQYDLAPDISIVDEGIVGDSCFRRLTFSASSPKRSFVLYLSPNQRFLTTELLDMQQSPMLERERFALDTQSQFLADKSPDRGLSGAAVTIVEFADFQCPFCKRFNQFLKSLGADEKLVRVVFKQFPLSIHSWARKASLMSACAGLQSRDSFWMLHDFFFANQELMTPEMFDKLTAEFLARNSEINIKALQVCLDKHDGDKVLERDFDLATKYHIDATPTVFVNGVREPGFQNGDELRAVVRHAVTSLEHKAARGVTVGRTDLFRANQKTDLFLVWERDR